MFQPQNGSCREAIHAAGILTAAAMTVVLPPAVARAHQGHDHAPRTILDLKGKRVRIVGPNEDAGAEVVEDRVTIRVDADGRIVDLSYG